MTKYSNQFNYSKVKGNANTQCMQITITPNLYML